MDQCRCQGRLQFLSIKPPMCSRRRGWQHHDDEFDGRDLTVTSLTSIQGTMSLGWPQHKTSNDSRSETTSLHVDIVLARSNMVGKPWTIWDADRNHCLTAMQQFESNRILLMHLQPLDCMVTVGVHMLDVFQVWGREELKLQTHISSVHACRGVKKKGKVHFVLLNVMEDQNMPPDRCMHANRKQVHAWTDV